MDLLDRIAEVRRRKLSYPVGPAVVEPFDKTFGHDDEVFVPEFYGNYLVTSNEIFSAAMLRARLASTVPIKFYSGDDEKKRQLPKSAPAQLLQQVNPHWTWPRLARMDELCMCLWGESVWAVERAPGLAPTQIWWLKPSRVFPVPHEKDYLAGFLYKSSVNGEEIAFRPDEIVWQRYPNPLDEYAALSPIAAARLAADTGSAMMLSNRKLFENGMQSPGFLMPKQKDGMSVQFTTTQAQELEDRLHKRFAGLDKAHRWAVLRYEAEVKAVSVTPKDAEFLGGLDLTMRQVCNAYSIPSPLLNDLAHATLANVREFQVALWEHGLVPDLTLRALEVREQFLPMFTNSPGRQKPDHVEYDFSGVAALQKAQTETWDRDRQAIEVGALTVNEWRAKQGLPPVKWGDVWWGPLNKGAVTDADSKPAGDAGDQAPTPDAEQFYDVDAAFARLRAEETWSLNGSHAP